MAVKTYKLRIDFHSLEKEKPADPQRFKDRAEEVRQWLWDTHVAFNRGVNYLVRELFSLRRGAGAWRQREGDHWKPWQSIRSLAKLRDCQRRREENPADFALVENTQLLKRLGFDGADDESDERRCRLGGFLFGSLR